jgi:hypothetical protein
MMQRAEIITIERRRCWGLSEKQGLSRSATGCSRARFFAWGKAAWDARLVEESGAEFAPVVNSAILGGRVLSCRLRQDGQAPSA